MGDRIPRYTHILLYTQAPRSRASVKMGNANSAMLENIVQGSNFDRDEVDRLRKRFMKLDKDNSGTIERDEFLSLPQVSSNPLATRGEHGREHEHDIGSILGIGIRTLSH